MIDKTDFLEGIHFQFLKFYHDIHNKYQNWSNEHGDDFKVKN